MPNTISLILLFIASPLQEVHLHTNYPSVSCSNHTSHPYIVFIAQMSSLTSAKRGKYHKIGTGALISLNWVLTARSRTELIDSYYMLKQVYAGSMHELDTEHGDSRRIDRVVKYEGKGDLALIKVEKPFKVKENIRPATLPPQRYFWRQCTTGRLYGYNIWSSLEKHMSCQTATFCATTSKYVCVAIDLNEFNNLMSAAGSVVICENDTLVGIVSNHVEDHPEKYVTSVAEYLSWIHKTTGIAYGNHSRKLVFNRALRVANFFSTVCLTLNFFVCHCTVALALT